MKRVLLFLALATVQAATLPRTSDELRFCLHGAPKTLDPLQASDSSSETIRYITSGTLVRLDRRTQQVLPELASSWKVKPDSREIEFTLRPGIRFSDGSPITPADIVYSLRKLLDPAVRSPLADTFRFGSGEVRAIQRGPHTVAVVFPKPVAQVPMKFDPVPILSERSPGSTAGPYYVGNHKAGSEIELRRNPYYWKRDEQGTQLPYIGVLRIRFQANREIELLDFERGDIDLIPQLQAEHAERIAAKNSGNLINLGLTLDWLILFFNQSPGSSLPPYKKAWFQSTAFRKALSLALSREDICRIAYRGKARPGVGPSSPANKLWFNPAMKPDPNNPAEALKRLQAAGFALRDGALFDSQGNRVEFSALTNAGNKIHERTLGLIQQDWKRIGVKLNVVTLDFPSLIERITRTYNFEACLLPMTNVAVEPEEQMNIWLSSGANHQWNPSQPAPATAWEKEMDEQMTLLATSVKMDERKRAFNRLQVIAAEQAPFLFLAHPETLGAVSAGLKINGAATWPYLLYGLEYARFSR